MRAFGVELANEGIETLLLLQTFEAWRPGRLLLEGEAHPSRSITFEAYAKQYIAGKEAGWKNKKHRQQWSKSLRDYAYSRLGSVAVADVNPEGVSAFR